tara:strand:- start:420 stop:719 length:300 start_codon:yes stop_codon:yes gene_type:complete
MPDAGRYPASGPRDTDDKSEPKPLLLFQDQTTDPEKAALCKNRSGQGVVLEARDMLRLTDQRRIFLRISNRMRRIDREYPHAQQERHLMQWKRPCHAVI